MTTCTVLERRMLPNPVDVRVDEKNLDFSTARLMAEQKAKELMDHPMLLGWYDSNKGRFSPNVTCCSEEKPGWLVYAETRGGNISITINRETYVFIYGDLM